QQRQPGVPAVVGHHDGGIAAYGQEGAMRQIDHAHHAEHDQKPDRDGEEHAAGRHDVEDGVDHRQPARQQAPLPHGGEGRGPPRRGGGVRVAPSRNSAFAGETLTRLASLATLSRGAGEGTSITFLGSESQQSTRYFGMPNGGSGLHCFGGIWTPRSSTTWYF